MRWIPAIGLMVAAGWFAGPDRAYAQVPPQSYAEAVRFIDTLYLYPEQVEAGSLLRAAARGLSEEIDWLMVETDARTVYLRHGDGTHLGSLSVASIQTLPEALLALEDLVMASGYRLDNIDVRIALLQGLTRALDRYSTVLSGDRLERFDVRLKGTLVGIGLSLRSRGDAMKITEIVPDGPADRAGLTVGELVVRIDGLSTTNLPMREAGRLIQGAAGTAVTLTVDRDGRLVDVVIQREEIVVPNVQHRVLDGQVGYVHISHFSQRTDENLRVALHDLAATGGLTGGLVLDLRGNTGGSMKDSARCADELVHAGMLLRTAGPDGGRVRNLQSRMDAVSAGDEPDVPVVVLMDDRTASGSEILAGALLHLDRAALLGSRSFGKGTVQKVYPLGPDARLKLTVARYLLAGDAPITERGLTPDLAVEDIVLDTAGVRVERADPSPTDPAPVYAITERSGWRGQPMPQPDVRLEIARRAVLGSSGPTRGALLDSLVRVGESYRIEAAEQLAEALDARGIDWSAPTPSHELLPQPDVDLSLQARPDPTTPGVVLVEVQLHNQEPTALEQVWVELDSASFGLWRGIAFPLGRIEPGDTAHSVYHLRPAIGLERREDEVTPSVRVGGRAPLALESVVLAVEGPPAPELQVEARYVDAGPQGRAEIGIRNLGEREVHGLEVAFGHPGELDIELLTHAAAVPTLAPRASAQVALDLSLGPQAPDHLPLGLVVTQGGSRSPLLEWPLELPRSGDALTLRAPRIRIETPERSGPVGTWTLPLHVLDDTRIDHVVVYVNGEKVAWAPGGTGSLEMKPAVPLRVGHNRVQVVAFDEQGLSARRTIDVRGELPVAVDAGG